METKSERKSEARESEDEKLAQSRWRHSDWCLERMRMSMVLQDCADKLAVLGHIASSHMTAGSEIAAEDEDSEMPCTEGMEWTEEDEKAENEREWRRMLKELRHQLDSKPLSPDILEKVEHDRQFLAQVIKEMLEELQEAGTISRLLAAVAEEKRKKAHHLDVIQREEEGRRRTQALQRQLRDIAKERALEVHRREEITAHLRAQLQEMKAKATMERDYMRGISHLKIQQGQEHNEHREQQLEAEVERLRERIAEELFIHEEVVGFLQELQKDLEEKLERWMESYETEVEGKQKEIDALKNARAKNAEYLVELREEVEQVGRGRLSEEEEEVDTEQEQDEGEEGDNEETMDESEQEPQESQDE